jgi:hypothetical protein
VQAEAREAGAEAKIIALDDGSSVEDAELAKEEAIEEVIEGADAELEAVPASGDHTKLTEKEMQAEIVEEELSEEDQRHAEAVKRSAEVARPWNTLRRSKGVPRDDTSVCRYFPIFTFLIRLSV